MKKLPLMLQLALILFCVMIIPTIVMTLYSGTQILGYSEKAIAQSTLDGLDSNQRLNESALNTVMQDTVRVASSSLYDGIRQYRSYAQLNSDYNRVEHALSILRELQRIARSNDGIYSAYFHLNDADYIVASDEGIIPIERYESIEWLQNSLSNKVGIGGVWQPRKMENGEMVMSYVLPLNRLSTSTKGVLVVNLKETQIEQNMVSSNQEDLGYTIIGLNNGEIISHSDKNLLLTPASEQPFMEQLLQQHAKKGYAFHELDGERLLYTWKKSDDLNWLYVNQYSMDHLMTQTKTVQRGIVIFTAIIILVGIVITVLIATWVSRPLRKLAGHIRAQGNMAFADRNELSFLDSAFRRMQEEEDKLNQLIEEREQDACSLAVHHLLRGDQLKSSQKELLHEMFPEKHYVVAVISIDHYNRYRNNTSPEARSYHRYAFISSYEKQLASLVINKSVYYGEGRIALLLNFDEGMLAKDRKLTQVLTCIQAEAMDLFGHSVTIGVSSMTEQALEVHSKLIEAMELIKQRIIAGNGQILYWNSEQQGNQKYVYPQNSERRLINYIDISDIDSIVAELDAIHELIQSTKSISYDNILFIYNQLIGVTVKYLNEKNINTSAIFAERGNIYSIIASMDTLDEITAYLKHFYTEISKFISTSNHSEVNYFEKIQSYLDQHYSEDIVFDDMAKEIGISYSYMRKLFYEGTGKSLIDYVNYKRIEAAKDLLIRSTLNVAQIAAEVGYNNIQSFNRFFRKYEGVTPSSYKGSKING